MTTESHESRSGWVLVEWTQAWSLFLPLCFERSKRYTIIMLLSSKLRPDIWSSVSFIVIHHYSDSVLLPVDLHAKYSDLLAFAEKEWDLKQQYVSFETDELSLCPGKLVRIHEQAWNGVKDVIGNLYVRVQEPSPPVREQKQASLSGVYLLYFSQRLWQGSLK